MRLLIDTNIILDVLFEREGLFEESKAVLKLCETGKIDGYITASSLTDLFYIIKKHLHSTEKTYDVLGQILNIVKILPVTTEDVNKAFLRREKDFEDTLQATCALTNKCEGIVTRNVKDFERMGLKILTPGETK